MKFYDTYMDREHTTAYKGLLAILVLISHIGSDRINDFGESFWRIVTPLGYLSVSCYLFLSGYGLMFSIDKRKDKYFKGFFKRRIFPIYFLYLFFAVVYCILYFEISNTQINLTDILYTISFGKTYVANGWYVQCIVAIYIFLFVAYKMLRTEKSKKNIPIVVVLMYAALCLIFDVNTLYYQSILAFIGGCYFYRYKLEIDKALSTIKGFLIFASVGGSVSILSFIGTYVVAEPTVKLCCKMVLCLVFPVFAMIMASRINVFWKILRFIGERSLELYLSQGIFFVLFGGEIKVNNIVLYSALISFGTFAVACLIYEANRMIKKIITRTKTEA